MIIDIDSHAGFCFGVIRAIEKAEELLSRGEGVNCLGEIVHNEIENERLRKMGMKTIKHNDLSNLAGQSVLLRAHGEPPSTYQLAELHGVKLVDATCPVVLGLQQRVKSAWLKMEAKKGTVVIYGKKGHAEVIGLLGQTNNRAIVVQDFTDLNGLDYSRPIEVFSQTTMEPDNYKQIVDEIRKRMATAGSNGEIRLKVNNTICGQVSNRKPHLIEFARQHDVMIFVSGTHSSNGKMLFQACLSANTRSYMVNEPEEVKPEWFAEAQSIGISGATSTPVWLLNDVAQKVKDISDR